MRAARRVEPEWLDELAPADPRAIASRRDLRRVNAVMLQAGIMRRLLHSVCHDRPPRWILDLGSGDGSFMLGAARRLAPVWPGVSLVLLDRQPVVTRSTLDAFDALGWKAEVIAADVFEFVEAADAPAADVCTANLFLHHFSDAQLGELLARAAEVAPRFVACEPRRAAWALAASRLLWLVGCNDVTRHDAVASVEAGFRGTELSALWPSDGDWVLREHLAGPFTHAFVARRAEAIGPA
ncbi:MAG TPA: methyltransferase domain-containing protein [Propylenella sp.]|nr:methyltransferase domain-containing protein [Propylenella sp.]